jgi:hypothetical protein
MPLVLILLFIYLLALLQCSGTFILLTAVFLATCAAASTQGAPGKH